MYPTVPWWSISPTLRNIELETRFLTYSEMYPGRICSTTLAYSINMGTYTLSCETQDHIGRRNNLKIRTQILETIMFDRLRET